MNPYTHTPHCREFPQSCTGKKCWYGLAKPGSQCPAICTSTCPACAYTAGFQAAKLAATKMVEQFLPEKERSCS